MLLRRWMRLDAGFHALAARAILAVFFGAVCTLIVAGPILMSHSHVHAGVLCYLCFSPFCHQIPARSFFILERPLAVCHRCAGLYLGLFFGCFLKISWDGPLHKARRWIVLGACSPLLLDALLPFAGLWQNTRASRFSTGLLLGCLISSLLAQGAAECLARSSQRRFAASHPPIKGGVS